MYKLLLFFSLSIFLLACNSAPEGKAQIADNGEVTAVSFGEEITKTDAIPYDEMVSKMAGTDSLAAKVIGTVEGVCQVKGCWINIVSDNPDQPDMFVKFKDYGFFMPKDIAGKKVIMEGYAFKEVTPVDELRHYAEDNGKSKEEIAAITQPKEELKFLASGVLLLN
ncbi:MAG: DUF4920 domain-containing protein [Bacteroidota bacterium]